MKARILGRTDVDRYSNIGSSDTEMSFNFAGLTAGVCYMPNTFDELLLQLQSKNIKRAENATMDKHHSIFGHEHITILFEDIPKIMAMVLNSVGAYNTSEKSARYTRMEKISDEEKVLYDKWFGILQEKISKTYPKLDANKVAKLAQENARYMISVFTPTTMVYTISVRDLQYTIHRANNFINNNMTTPFYIKLKEVMIDFVESVTKIIDVYEELNPYSRPDFMFINNNTDEWRDINIYYGTTYADKYIASFAALAQLQRHRTLDYMMYFSGNDPVTYYLPPIVYEHDLSEEWFRDIKSVADNFPQGTHVRVVETGTFDNFLLKAYERECTCAQLEVYHLTKLTHMKYITQSNLSKSEKVKLEQYSEMIRCWFNPPFKCNKPCKFSYKEKKERII